MAVQIRRPRSRVVVACQDGRCPLCRRELTVVPQKGGAAWRCGCNGAPFRPQPSYRTLVAG